MSVASPKAKRAQVPTAPSATPILISAPKSSKEPEGIAVSALVHAVRRRWPLALLLGIAIGAATAATTWFLLWPKYTSSAYIQIDARHVPLLFTTADQVEGGRNDFKTFKGTQRQKLLTPFVLNNALSNDAVANLAVVRDEQNPTQWLQEKLEVAFPDDGEIMKVSLSDYDIEAPQAIVQAVIDAYMSEVVDTEHKARTARLLSLQKASKDVQEKIRTGRKSLGILAETLGTGDEESLSLAERTAIERYGITQTKLMEVQFERITAEGELELWQSYRAAKPSTDGAAQVSATDGDASEPTLHDVQAVSADASPSVSAEATPPENVNPSTPEVYISEYAYEMAVASDFKARELTVEVERLETRIRKAHERLDAETAGDYVQPFEVQLSNKQRELEERKTFIRTEMVKSEQYRLLQQDKSNHGALLGLDKETDLKMRIRLLKRQEEKFQVMADQAENEAKKLGRSSIEVEMTRAELSSLDGIAEGVRQEIERTKIELASDERIELIGQVEPAYPPDPLKRTVIVSLAGVGGFFMPLLLLVWTDVRHKHVDGTSSVADSLKLNVLGSVPRIPPRLLKDIDKDESTQSRHWRSKLIESASSIAALLMRTSHTDGKRIFMITSPTQGEGKSTVSVHVAKTLAEANLKTLLIDFDLRRPTLHNAFGVSSEPGVAEVLAGQSELSECIHATDTPNLSVLAAGKRRASILTNSQTGVLEELFAKLRTEYEFVIVDACPILPVVDARVVGQHVDGVILSLARDVSRIPKAMRTCELMAAHGIEVLGTIVVGCGETDDYYADRKYLT